MSSFQSSLHQEFLDYDFEIRRRKEQQYEFLIGGLEEEEEVDKKTSMVS